MFISYDAIKVAVTLHATLTTAALASDMTATPWILLDKIENPEVPIA
jgi:hypothetical protein